MTPKEVIQLLREHALELIEFHDQMSLTSKISATEADEILKLCLYLIEELAENRWFASTIIEKYESGEPPIFVKNGNNNNVRSVDLAEPPFEANFFLNHQDL